MAVGALVHPQTNKTEDLINYALDYARRGWAVLPLYTVKNGRCTCGKPGCISPGKHPRLNGWQELPPADEETIRRWWRQWPDSNLGIATGAKSGFVVLDVDGDEGEASLAELENRYGRLPATVEQISGSRGRHLLFKYPGAPVKNGVGIAPKLDLRGDRGQIVVEPSIHHTGRTYAWDIGAHPDDTEIAELPPWILEVASKGHDKKGAPEAPEAIPAGQRNATLTSLAGSMRRRGLDSGEILPALRAINENRCVPPLSEAELVNIARSVNRYPPEQQAGTEVHNTDLGNARRLVVQHGKDLRYCHLRGKWFVYDGRRWIKDATGEIERKAKRTVVALGSEAALISDDDARKAALKWALRSESDARIAAMIALAQSEPEVPVLIDDMDANPWLLNCNNGTIDLRTGELGPHRRTDLITKLVPVDYDPEAECPLWGAFLDTSMDGNKNLMGFLARALGYSLTGDTSEQALFLLYGTGANGKSTFLEVNRALLGEYAQTADFSTFLIRDRDSARNDIARLVGKRFVAAAEVEGGRRMAEVLVKQLTGGDTIAARFLFREYFEFRPTFKIWLAANHKPTIRGSDHAIWRRIRLIPFTVTIPADQQDPRLSEKLRDELPGILAWAVRGCLEWQRDGLGVPDEVKAATEGYRQEMDALADFLAENCIVADYARVKAGALYETYREWCKSTGEDALSQKALGMRLTERGFQRQRSTGNAHFWYGIGLSVETESDPRTHSDPYSR